jgi:membrane-bound serine protease (ClpP class)
VSRPCALRPSAHSIVLLAALLLLAALAGAQTAPAAPAAPVIVLEIDGVIGPATAEFFDRSMAKAQKRGASLVVLRMDTPGGLDDSMRRIIKQILASPIPVATFVAPEGARAASAGTYILYASHIAAMAPATNLGAATPVAIGGTPSAPEPERPRERDAEDAGASKGEKSGNGQRKTERRAAPASRDSMREKAINDAAAYIRGLAQLRGRNADFAEQAVLQATSMSSDEAAKGGVIDVVATSVADLLQKIDGRTIQLPSGKVTLSVANAPVENVSPDWRTQMLGVLSNPTLAMVLMMVGIYGLFVEFTSPGFGVPGVAGAIALLLALYAFQLLPVNWAGVALLGLGALLMIGEVFLPSFGALGVGGIIAFVVGGLMIFDMEEPHFAVSWPFIVGLALVSALSIAAFGAFALKSRGRPVVSGREDMIGAPGVVDAIHGDQAWAQVRGERWRVVSPAALQPGDRVLVTEINGLTLSVDKVTNNRS